VKQRRITFEALVFLTAGVILRWTPCMRRKLEVRVSFAPTRLSATYLRTAYEQVLPLKKASVWESIKASEEHSQFKGPVRAVSQAT